MRRFLADASHELRTPLTSIRGYAELFDLGARSRPDDLETAMRHIREEAARMGVLVDDLLLLARLDHQRPLSLQVVDLVPVARRAVEARRVTAPGRRIELEAPESLLVEGDGDRLRQVVDNLVVNALRHAPPALPVTVRLARRPWGDASTRPADHTAVIEVEDHGPGVPEEQRSRIFEPFFRPDASRARGTGGAGLGLAIVAAIARAHGGMATVVATAGGGATFRVIVPDRVPPAQAGGKPAEPPARGDAAGWTGIRQAELGRSPASGG